MSEVMDKKSIKIAIEALKYYNKKKWAVDASFFRLGMCDNPTCITAAQKHEEATIAIKELEACLKNTLNK